MNYLIKSLYSLLIICLVAGVTTAQDETAASVYNEGLTLLKAKNYTDGLAKMQKAIELAEASENEQVLGLAKKNGSIAASNLGNTSYKAKDFETALAHYSTGLELNPENSSNAIGKARVLDKTGKQIEAIEAFILAGGLYNKSSKADRAKKSYKQAQNIVGKLYVDKDYDTAVAAGDKFLAARDNAEVRYYISRSLIEKDDNEAALEHITKAIEMASAAGKVADKYYMAQGMSLENLGRNGEALTAYGKITGEKYKKQAQYRISQLKA